MSLDWIGDGNPAFQTAFQTGRCILQYSNYSYVLYTKKCYTHAISVPLILYLLLTNNEDISSNISRGLHINKTTPTQAAHETAREQTITQKPPRSQDPKLLEDEMSESFFCLDCYRSITFLKVGSTKHMEIMIENAPIKTLFGSSLTYVRCAVCISSKGRLSTGNNPTEFISKVPHGIQKILLNEIATFMKKREWEIAVVTNGTSDMSEKPAHKNIDEALGTYIYGMACVSLDQGGPTSPYEDFYSKTEWGSRQIPDTKVNSQPSCHSEEKTALQNGKVPHITNIQQSSDVQTRNNTELSSYSERIVTQIKKVSNATEGSLDLFCPYCKPSEVDACYGNSFMTYVEGTKVRMYPRKLPSAGTLVVFTCDIHLSTHIENIRTSGSEAQVHKTNLEGLLKLWDYSYRMRGLTSRWPYMTILNVKYSESYMITELDLELGMWMLWSGYYDYYPSEFDTFDGGVVGHSTYADPPFVYDDDDILVGV